MKTYMPMLIMDCSTRFRLKDVRALARLVGEEWNLNQDKQGKLGRYAYAFWVARVGHFVSKIIVDDKIVAIGALQIYNKRPKWLYVILYYLTIFLFKDKKAYKEYQQVYDNGLEGWKEKYDTEVDILIVDKNHRRSGYGAYILKNLESIARVHGKTLKVETYNNCSYNFYEKRGYKKVFENPMDCPNEDAKVAMVYVKEFA